MSKHYVDGFMPVFTGLDLAAQQMYRRIRELEDQRARLNDKIFRDLRQDADLLETINEEKDALKKLETLIAQESSTDRR